MGVLGQLLGQVGGNLINELFAAQARKRAEEKAELDRQRGVAQQGRTFDFVQDSFNSFQDFQNQQSQALQGGFEPPPNNQFPAALSPLQIAGDPRRLLNVGNVVAPGSPDALANAADLRFQLPQLPEGGINKGGQSLLLNMLSQQGQNNPFTQTGEKKLEQLDAATIAAGKEIMATQGPKAAFDYIMNPQGSEIDFPKIRQERIKGDARLKAEGRREGSGGVAGTTPPQRRKVRKDARAQAEKDGFSDPDVVRIVQRDLEKKRGESGSRTAFKPGSPGERSFFRRHRAYKAFVERRTRELEQEGLNIGGQPTSQAPTSKSGGSFRDKLAGSSDVNF